MPVRQQMQTPRSNLTECSQFWLIWYTQTAAVSIGQGGIHKPYVPAYSGINQQLDCVQFVLARILYTHCMCRVGQNCIYTPYMTVYLVISLPKYRIYTVYIWFWSTLCMCLHIRESSCACLLACYTHRMYLYRVYACVWS